MPLSTQSRTRSNELSTLDLRISKGRTVSSIVRTALDAAAARRHQPFLGIPYIQNDGKFGQYWSTLRSEQYRTYIALGLAGGHAGSRVKCSAISYEPKTATSRTKRFINYLSASGLSAWHSSAIQTFLDEITDDTRLSWVQAEALAQRCGFYPLVNPFFAACRAENVMVWGLYCVLRGADGQLVWDRSNGNKLHFSTVHGYSSEDGVGRCHFPGCDIVFAVPADKEYARAIK